MSAPMTAEEKIDDLLAGIRSLAGGYEKVRVVPSGPEIASDIRTLLQIVDAPEDEHLRLVAARRRAKYVVDRVACPRCGRERGTPCVSQHVALGADPERDRVYPHRERELAERERR